MQEAPATRESITPRYRRFFDEVRADVEEFLVTGSIGRARELSRLTGQDFRDDEPPQFFVGDLDSPFVLIHLNPKAGREDGARRLQREVSFQTFEEYVDEYRHFGARMYGPSSPRTHRSPFDYKQIRFLRAFGVIDFVEERTRSDAFANLERVIDQKLQLELIPYGSTSFSTRGLTDDVLRPHYERVMSVIAARPRDYIIFCGAVFANLRLVSDHVVEEHRFALTKVDGTQMRDDSRFGVLELPADGKRVTAGLAYSWARQGLPMTAYAEKIRDVLASPAR